jgi:hypothetical protein
MMLHVRDCPGTTASFDVCPFPWCRKVKHLLYHLVSCTDPDQCTICNGSMLPMNMRRLHFLNAYRGRQYHSALAEKTQNDTAKAKAKALNNSNGISSKTHPAGQPSGSERPAAIEAASEDPEIAAAAGAVPTPIVPGQSHPDLSAIAGSSNSLAALAAAADALAAEDFDADLDSTTDDVLLAAGTIDPVYTSIHAPGAVLMEAGNFTLTEASVPKVAPDIRATPIKAEGEVDTNSPLLAADASIQNEVAAKLENVEDALPLDVDTKPMSLVPVKMEDDLDSSTVPVTVAEQSPKLLSALDSTIEESQPASGTDSAERKDVNSDPSMASKDCADNSVVVVDNDQTESPTNRSETTRAEPLRV